VAIVPLAVLVAILLGLTGGDVATTGPVTVALALAAGAVVALALAFQMSRWADRVLLDPLNDLQAAMSGLDPSGSGYGALRESGSADDPLSAEVGSEDPVYSGLAASLTSTQAAVRHAAVTAEEGRSHLQAVLVNVGERQRSLASRQLGLLHDTDHANLSADSVATIERLALRSMRTADTVLTLAGDIEIESPGRDESVATVIARSIAHLDDADRVDAHSVEAVVVASDAVADLQHILGELIDNAVRYSSADTPVVVLGRHTSDGYILSVVDEGPGMTGEERLSANSRLGAQAGLFETAPTTFGFVVAGQVAARNDFRVMLLESATDGIIAKLRIPEHALLEQAFSTGTDDQLEADEEQHENVDAAFGDDLEPEVQEVDAEFAPPSAREDPTTGAMARRRAGMKRAGRKRGDRGAAASALASRRSTLETATGTARAGSPTAEDSEAGESPEGTEGEDRHESTGETRTSSDTDTSSNTGAATAEADTDPGDANHDQNGDDPASANSQVIDQSIEPSAERALDQSGVSSIPAATEPTSAASVMPSRATGLKEALSGLADEGQTVGLSPDDQPAGDADRPFPAVSDQDQPWQGSLERRRPNRRPTPMASPQPDRVPAATDRNETVDRIRARLRSRDINIGETTDPTDT